MRRIQRASRAAVLTTLVLAFVAVACSQSTPSATPSSTTPAPANSPADTTKTTTPSAQPPAGTAQAGGDAPATAPTKKPAPGTTPVGGDVAAPKVDPDKVIEPGSQKINVKPGSMEDVNAVGNRDIGGRGMGNWYSTDYEIKMGKSTPWRSRRAPGSSPIRWSSST